MCDARSYLVFTAGFCVNCESPENRTENPLALDAHAQQFDADSVSTYDAASKNDLLTWRSRVTEFWVKRAILRTAMIFSFYAVLLLVIVTPLLVRVHWEGRAELQSADLALEEGDREREILHLGRAARWRLPLVDHDELALERLIRMGVQAERDPELGRDFALVAYREARRAILATRAWGLSSPETFNLVNRRIARLMAEQEIEFQTDLSGQGKQEEYHLHLLQVIPGQGALGVHYSSIAFILWAVALLGFVTQAIDLRGNLRGKRAFCWGGASLVLLFTWTLLMRYSEPFTASDYPVMQMGSMPDEYE